MLQRRTCGNTVGGWSTTKQDKQVIKYGRMIVSSALSACYIPKSPSFAELQDLQDCVTALRLLKKWSQCQELSKGAMEPQRMRGVCRSNIDIKSTCSNVQTCTAKEALLSPFPHIFALWWVNPNWAPHSVFRSLLWISAVCYSSRAWICLLPAAAKRYVAARHSISNVPG